MKKISYLIYLVLLYANGLLAQTVVINDLGLSQGLKENLGLTETQNITVSQLNSLKELDLTGYGILDMAGLQNCINLEYLKISSNQISNLSAISNLSKLKYLDLSSNTLTSINTLTVLRDCIVFVDNNYIINTPILHSSNTIKGLTNQRNDEKLGNFNFTIRPQIIDANLRKVRIYYRSGSDLNNNALMNVGDQRRNNDPYDFGFYNCISDGQTRYIDHTYNDYGTFTVFLYFLINGTQSTKISCSFNLIQPPPVIPTTVINIETPTSVSMGSVNVGGSFDKIITIKNASTSNAVLTGTIAPISGVDMSIISGSQTLNLAPNQSQDITVRFSPKSGGVYNNSLTINGNFSGSSKNITLTGTGVTVLPTLTYSRPAGQTYSLLDAPMGSFSDAIITVSNYSPVAFSGSFAVTGSGYSGILMGGSGSNLNIPAGGSQNITVRFTPTANGVSTGSLSITGSATNTPATFNFSTFGTGFPTSGCVTSSTINITSNVNISTSGWREFGRFTLTNTSSSLPANISNFQAGPSDNFRISGYQQNAQFSLNPNESREFIVEISPISTQAYYNGVIGLNTPIQSCNSLRIQLRGTPAVSALTPPPLVTPAVDEILPYRGFDYTLNLGIRQGNMFGVAKYKYFLIDMTSNQVILDNFDRGVFNSGNAETLRGFTVPIPGVTNPVTLEQQYKVVTGHRYSWKVRAESVSDPNVFADSELRYFSAQQPSVCYAPSDFSITQITKNSALVTWNPITTVYQNQPTYNIQTSIDNGVTFSTVVVNTSSTSVIVSGLSNLQNYRIRLQTNCLSGAFTANEYTRSQPSINKSFTTLADCSTLTATIAPNSTQTICQGSSVNLTASVGSSYQWYKDDALIMGATNQVYAARLAGTYKVKVAYSNGCEVFSSAVSVTEIVKPQVLITALASGICPNGSVSISATQLANTTYQWVKDGVNIPNTNSSSYSATSSGVYRLNFTQNGCTFTTDLLNLPLLPTPSIYISGIIDLTIGNTLSLSAFGANSYTWTGSNFTSTANQITIPNVQIANAGNYSIVGLGANGCSSNVNFTVTVSPPVCTIPTAILTGTQTINIGQSANLSVAFTGNAPYSFVVNGQTYSNISANPYAFSVTPTTTTTYNLSGVNNACGAGTFSGSAVVAINGVGNCPPTVTHSGSIASNTYRASQNIISTANVPSNTKYYSGQSVTLSAGFSAGPNENFEAKIEGCATIPTNGLVAYYGLDGNANDGSGNGNNLTSTGTTSSVADRKNQVLKATGYGGNTSVGYQSATNSTSLQFATGFSVSLWYKLPSYAGMDGFRQQNVNGYQILIAKEGDRSGFYVGISNDAVNNKQSINFTNNPSNGVNNFNVTASPDGTAASNLDKWVYLVVTAGDGNAKIFIDGVLKNTASISSINFSGMNSKNLFLGTMQALGTHWYPYSGALDEVRIYNRAITDAEVLQIYNAEKP